MKNESKSHQQFLNNYLRAYAFIESKGSEAASALAQNKVL